jgi:voltage-gated potassium channel
MVTLLSVVFIVSTFIIFVFEKQQTPELTLFDAFRIVLVFFLGEYGDTPKTLVGQIVSILLFVVGIVIVATLIGKIASVFVGLRMEAKMPKNLDSHIIICNWNDRGDRIVKEIHSPLASPESQIITITEKELNEEELRSSSAYEKVYFVRSDPTLHEVLKRTRAHLAKSVIILADTNCSDPDAKTALIALAITKLEKGMEHKPHIVAEVMNHHKIQHLLDAGVDEWVCSSDYGLGIIAQCALYGKLSDVYQQLLTYSKDTNEIYLIESGCYPASFISKGFGDIAKILDKGRDSDNPVILLGVKRADRIILNPKKKDFETLEKNDSLIVMSFDQPDIRDITS